MIEVDKAGGLWTVTLCRADKANALTKEMLTDIRDAANQASKRARAFILTGAGKVFSGGADLEAVRTGLAQDPVWEETSAAIARLPCISIAALNGTLAGGAFGMVLACDLRIAVPGASLFYPVMRLGQLPQPSDPGRLVDLVGPARAKLILLAGRKITAQSAMEMGLVDEIAEDPVSRAREFAQDALAADPAHAARIKAMLYGTKRHP